MKQLRFESYTYQYSDIKTKVLPMGSEKYEKLRLTELNVHII